MHIYLAYVKLTSYIVTILYIDEQITKCFTWVFQYSLYYESCYGKICIV